MPPLESKRPTGKLEEAHAPAILSLEHKTLVSRRTQSIHVREATQPITIDVDDKLWIAAHFCFSYSPEYKIHRLLLKLNNKFYSWEFIDPGMNLHERFQIIDWIPGDPTPSEESYNFNLPVRRNRRL